MVGVDADGAAVDALSWAAAEAATQHCPLRIVHVFHQPALVDPYGVLPSAEIGMSEARKAAERVPRDAVAKVWSIAPDLQVSARLLSGTAARELLGEAARARLLVVGNRGLSGMRGLLAGSVSVQVCARARCPVVVVHPFHGVCPGWSPPRVVVGVEATASCAPAIGFAFRAARQRGIPLTAMHAWTPDTPADFEGIHGDPELAEYLGLCAVERALECWRDLYADVPVVVKVVQGDPARALIAESAGAALVVVGSRGRGHLWGMLRASVSQTVLRQADSPVAVVSQLYTAPEVGIPRSSVTDRTRHRPPWRRKRPMRP